MNFHSATALSFIAGSACRVTPLPAPIIDINFGVVKVKKHSSSKLNELSLDLPCAIQKECDGLAVAHWLLETFP